MDAVKIIAGVGASVLSMFGGHMGHASSTPPAPQHTMNITCIGTAVNTRETTLDGAVASYIAAITNAYAVRASALSSAYALTTGTDAVRSAEKTAWSGFASSTQSARQSFKTTHNSAWSQFGTAVKACGGTAPQQSDSVNATLDTSI